MSSSINTFFIVSLIFIFVGLCIGILIGAKSPIFNEKQIIQSERFGGAVPMKVYQIYDRDTGVYYAVTEKGGITVMYTMEGKIKLVDEGDGALYHPNQGESND